MKNLGSLVAAMGCLVVLSACGTETTPLGSDSFAPPATALAQASGNIGHAGGTVANGVKQLMVPQGSLSTATRITMDTVLVDGEEVTELGPDGLQFANGCVLRLPVPPGSAPSDEFSVEWYDPAAGEWVDIGGQRVGNDVQVVLHHFSRYRVTSFSS